MKNLFAGCLPILFLSLAGNAQVKVASYCTGKYGTLQYEHLSFWTENGKRTYIEYSYGSNPKNIKLKFLGKSIVNGKPCMKVLFPNKLILTIFAEDANLHAQDSSGKYDKTFTWEYEGPVNGIGTFCDICAADEYEAMKIVTKNYLQ